MARLVPIRSGATRPEEVIAELRRAREGITLGDVTIRDLIEDGRR